MADQDTHDELLSMSHFSPEEQMRFSSPAPQIEGYQILDKLGEAGPGLASGSVEHPATGGIESAPHRFAVFQEGPGPV
jgi:hypothetical protein